jgi:hypothetical protein
MKEGEYGKKKEKKELKKGKGRECYEVYKG